MIYPFDGLERFAQWSKGDGVVNFSLMDSSQVQSADALQSALRAARENENRWVGMSPEFTSDNERMEQWASTARLRRLEVERIEALLAKTTDVRTCIKHGGDHPGAAVVLPIDDVASYSKKSILRLLLRREATSESTRFGVPPPPLIQVLFEEKQLQRALALVCRPHL